MDQMHLDQRNGMNKFCGDPIEKITFKENAATNIFNKNLARCSVESFHSFYPKTTHTTQASNSICKAAINILNKSIYSRGDSGAKSSNLLKTFRTKTYPKR